MIDYSRFFEAAFDLLAVMSRTHFLDVNQTTLDKFGYSKEELLSRPLLDFVHDDYKAEAMETFAHYVPPSTMEPGRRCAYITKGGGLLYLEWRVHPDTDNETRFYSVGRDVTQEKVIEDQLGKYVISLQRSAMEARRSKEEAQAFAYAASHDLQEPLRTISTWAGFLKDDYGAQLPAEGLEHLEYILDASKRGRALVNDLLQLSRVGRTAAFSWHDANEIVDSAVTDNEISIRESGAMVTRLELPRVWGDASMLRLLFANLLSNAIKFAKPNCAPRVHVDCVEEEDDWHFTVHDDGIGLDPQFDQEIFRVFRRLDPTRPGTGIGLALCEKVVRLHGGKIWVESTPGHGAVVHFTVSKPTGITYDETPHPLGGGSPTGREDAGASAGVDDDPARTIDRPRRIRGPEVLASGGYLRDRPSSRFGSSRSESTPSDGVRRIGKGKE